VFQDGSDGWPTLTLPTPIRRNVADNFKAESNKSAPASRYQPIDQLSITRRAFTPTYILLWLSIHTAVQRLETNGLVTRTPKGLALNPNASLAYRIGRSAYPREMRPVNTTRSHRSRTCVPNCGKFVYH
jgi:hypothetical protein